MGAVQSKLQWGDRNPVVATKDGLPRLQTSVSNQELLHELVRMIEQLCATFPTESRAEFRKPLQWASSLTQASFASHTGATQWIVGGKGHKLTVVSAAQRSDGQPVFYMEQIGASGTESAVFSARVSSFDYLNRVLQVADEYKLRELQAIIETNRDPFNNIFGITNEGGKGLVEAFDIYNNETDPRKHDQYSKLYKLLLVLNSFDLQLTQLTLQNMHNEKVLDIHKVSDELLMLQAFCGPDALILIDCWIADYTFANGAKAPPWRQVYGELCYIGVQCRDREEFIVTATKNGYFVNKGYTADEKGNEHLDYEKDSEVFATLVELLKAMSPHFALHIDKQEYLYHREPTDAGLTAAAAESLDHLDDNAASDDKQDHGDEAGGQGKERKTEKESNKRNVQNKKK
eukprot:jgi/Hompol1/420/HPOL_004655-RA